LLLPSEDGNLSPVRKLFSYFGQVPPQPLLVRWGNPDSR